LAFSLRGRKYKISGVCHNFYLVELIY